MEEQLRAAEIEIDLLRAQLAEMKYQRDALNEELSIEREHRFRLLTLRRNWLQSVVHILRVWFGPKEK
jgi:hypothetical protein